MSADWHGPGRRDRQRDRGKWSVLLWALVFPRGGQRILPTMSGVILIGLALGIGTAAYNTANKILFITLSLLLACLVLSGVLSWLNFQGVTWRVQLAPPLRAGQKAVFALELRNEKKFLPTHGLWFDVVTHPEPGTAVAPAPAKARSVREILAAAGLARTHGRLFLRDRLDPADVVRLDWAFTPARRGRQRLALESVGSLFPFGFLKKHLNSGLRHEVIVWPAPVEYRRCGGAGARPQSEGAHRAQAGSGSDLRALRRYEPGDSHRLIHWKASARLRQLLVRQFAAESQETFALWLQTPADVWPRPGQFELLVSFAATLAEDLFRAGKLASVALNAGAPRPVRRVHDLEAFLDQLAVVQPAMGEGGAPPVGRVPPSVAASMWGEGTPPPSTRRKNIITFAPDGARGVAAYVDGEKTAAA